MQIENLNQGSPEWHAFRLEHFGASEIAAVLGLSKNTTRTELLRAKKTGVAKAYRIAKNKPARSDRKRSRIREKMTTAPAADNGAMQRACITNAPNPSLMSRPRLHASA